MNYKPNFLSLSSYSLSLDISRSKWLWRFNNSLYHKPDFVTELKVICNRMSPEQITDKQLCWKYIIYEIKKISQLFKKKKIKKNKNTGRNCDFRK